MGDDYERILCVKNDVNVYQIPARTTNRGYKASEWKLEEPSWIGRLRVTAKKEELFIKLEDKMTGELFASCPVDGYPGAAVEQVLDSSRYFVIRIKDPSGRQAFIGIGFGDRGDSFDLIVAIQDHFKWVKREAQQAQAAANFDPGPKLDLGFKEGQTIKINIKTKKKPEYEDDDDDDAPKSRPKARPRGTGGAAIGLLPPPPGGARIAPPPGAKPVVHAAPPPSQAAVPAPAPAAVPAPVAAPAAAPPSAAPAGGGTVDLLGLDLSDMSLSNNQTAPPPSQPAKKDPFADLLGSSNSSSTSWAQFN